MARQVVLGCNQAHYDDSVHHNSLVYLHFGAQNSATQVYLVINQYINLTAVEGIAESFMDGYRFCTNGTEFLTLSLAVNNDGSAVGTATGNAWGNVVTTVFNYLVAKGYGNYMEVEGGCDCESWSGPHATGSVAMTWLQGFNATNPNSLLFFNWGSADGCPPSGTCLNGWSQDDYYYISWEYSIAEAGGPQIYSTSCAEANQWQQISLWGVLHHSTGRIPFQSAQDEYDRNSGTNTATQAYNCLLFALNSDSRTSVSDLSYSVEIHNAA
jgi:hypothetical protein